MGKINKQVEKWMTKATFDALDKSTIPVGTEINVVGDIEESDLSVDLQNKINAGGHYWKLEVDTSTGMYGKFTFFANTTANSLTDLASDLVEQKVIQGNVILEPNDMWNNGADLYGNAVAYISTAAVGSADNTLSLNFSVIFHYNLVGSVSSADIQTHNYSMTSTATVTKLW